MTYTLPPNKSFHNAPAVAVAALLQLVSGRDAEEWMTHPNILNRVDSPNNNYLFTVRAGLCLLGLRPWSYFSEACEKKIKHGGNHENATLYEWQWVMPIVCCCGIQALRDGAVEEARIIRQLAGVWYAVLAAYGTPYIPERFMYYENGTPGRETRISVSNYPDTPPWTLAPGSRWFMKDWDGDGSELDAYLAGHQQMALQLALNTPGRNPNHITSKGNTSPTWALLSLYHNRPYTGKAMFRREIDPQVFGWSEEDRAILRGAIERNFQGPQGEEGKRVIMRLTKGAYSRSMLHVVRSGQRMVVRTERDTSSTKPALMLAEVTPASAKFYLPIPWKSHRHSDQHTEVRDNGRTWAVAGEGGAEYKVTLPETIHAQGSFVRNRKGFVFSGVDEEPPPPPPPVDPPPDDPPPPDDDDRDIWERIRDWFRSWWPF